VNIFNSSGLLQAKVTCGSSTDGFTFDNAARLNNAAISQLSAAGVNGAFFNGASSLAETGSPGFAPIPEPSTYALILGIGAMGLVTLRRKLGLHA
jgi:hypothetical protein